MKENLSNACWPFYLDNVNSFAFWENAFTKEECDKIIKIGKNKKMKLATVLGEDQSIRSSNITWLYFADDMEWVFKRVTDIVLNLNERFFNFDLFGLGEGFQFTHYEAPNGKFGKHIDRGANFITRKLSLSIQLTDPKTYEGGELVIYESEKGGGVPKGQGTLILFPSFMLHEVTPVTKNERYSLVSWVTGKPFK